MSTASASPARPSDTSSTLAMALQRCGAIGRVGLRACPHLEHFDELLELASSARSTGSRISAASRLSSSRVSPMLRAPPRRLPRRPAPRRAPSCTPRARRWDLRAAWRRARRSPCAAEPARPRLGDGRLGAQVVEQLGPHFLGAVEPIERRTSTLRVGRLRASRPRAGTRWPRAVVEVLLEPLGRLHEEGELEGPARRPEVSSTRRR